MRERSDWGVVLVVGLGLGVGSLVLIRYWEWITPFGGWVEQVGYWLFG